MPLRGAIVDLDGTVYRGDTLLPGVSEAVDALRSAELSLLFFSNNPTKDGSEYVDHLSALGLDVRFGEACSAGDVTAEYLRRNHSEDDVLLVGSDGLRAQLERAGVSLTRDADETDVLLGSWTNGFDYKSMRIALAAVDDDTVFLGTDPDRTFPHDDELIPASGAIIGSLAATIGREPDAVLGKPSETARSMALDRLDVPADECLVIGDRLSTDLAMGEAAGMTTALVLTGVSDRSDVAASPVDPDYVLDGMGDIDTVLSAEK